MSCPYLNLNFQLIFLILNLVKLYQLFFLKFDPYLDLLTCCFPNFGLVRLHEYYYYQFISSKHPDIPDLQFF